MGSSPFLRDLIQRKNQDELYQMDALYDAGAGPFSQMNQASDQVQRGVHNSKLSIPHCVIVSQILFRWVQNCNLHFKICNYFR